MDELDQFRLKLFKARLSKGAISMFEVELTSPTSKTIYNEHKGADSMAEIELTSPNSKTIYKEREGDVCPAEIELT